MTLKVVYRPLSALKAAPVNARAHSPAQIEQIVASMREFGPTNPILIDERAEIIAGHGRAAAAAIAGIDPYPTITLAGLTRAQKRAYLLADNQLALNASWDMDVLRAELEALGGEDFDLGVIGFSDDELTAILSPGNEGLTDPDDAPDIQEAAVSVLGDIWTLGDHRIICGDSTDAATVTALLDGAKPHLMVTDPPYGVSYDPMWREGLGRAMKGSEGTQRVASGKVVNRFRANATGKVMNDGQWDWTGARHLFGGDVAYVWHGGLHAGSVAASLEAAGFGIRAQIIWAKQNQVFSRGDYHWRHEPCWYVVRAGKAGRWAGDRKQTTLWEIQNHNPMGGNREEVQTGHGTQKPIECMKRPIENNSKPGDAVYEPFSGSGTTIIAAELTGRKCYAIELSPNYVDLAVRRWEAFTGQAATHAVTGETFAAASEQRLPAAA